MSGRHGKDPEWLSDLVVDAMAIGEQAAANRAGVSRITVRRAKTKAKEDPELAALVAAKFAEVSHDLSVLRVSFLREALEVARGKLAKSKLGEVASAIKIIGELHQTAMMVGGDEFQSNEPSEVAPEAEGGSGGVQSEADGEASARH